MPDASPLDVGTYTQLTVRIYPSLRASVSVLDDKAQLHRTRDFARLWDLSDCRAAPSPEVSPAARGTRRTSLVHLLLLATVSPALADASDVLAKLSFACTRPAL